MKRAYVAVFCQELFKASIVLYAVVTLLANIDGDFTASIFNPAALFVVSLLAGLLGTSL